MGKMASHIRPNGFADEKKKKGRRVYSGARGREFPERREIGQGNVTTTGF